MKHGTKFAVVSVGAALAMLTVAGCGGSGSTGAVGSKPASATVAATPSTPSASPTPTPSAAAGAPKIIDVPGYSYADLHSELQPFVTSIRASTLVSGADAREVMSGSGEDIAALVVAQYDASLVPGLDAQAATKVLAAAAAGAKAASGVGGTSKEGVVGTLHYELISGSQISFALAYKKGGLLIEVIGPKAAGIEAFIRAYLKAEGS